MCCSLTEQTLSQISLINFKKKASAVSDPVPMLPTWANFCEFATTFSLFFWQIFSFWGCWGKDSLPKAASSETEQKGQLLSNAECKEWKTRGSVFFFFFFFCVIT